MNSEKKKYEPAEAEIIPLRADFLITSDLTVTDSTDDDSWQKIRFIDLQ